MKSATFINKVQKGSFTPQQRVRHSHRLRSKSSDPYQRAIHITDRSRRKAQNALDKLRERVEMINKRPRGSASIPDYCGVFVQSKTQRIGSYQKEVPNQRFGLRHASGFPKTGKYNVDGPGMLYARLGRFMRYLRVWDGTLNREPVFGTSWLWLYWLGRNSGIICLFSSTDERTQCLQALKAGEIRVHIYMLKRTAL
jgi:hypothetical protein